MENPESIRSFWFGNSPDDAIMAKDNSKMWWSKQPDLDAQIRARFEETFEAAVAGRLDSWADTASGTLALILLTDQFPRNMYRGTPAAFAQDGLARRWALEGLARGDDKKLRPIERVFFYLPLEHAESLPLQTQAVSLFNQLFQDVPADQMELFRGFLMYALRHRRVIERFGRFPHRNEILQRPGTEEEVAFLLEPGSSF